MSFQRYSTEEVLTAAREGSTLVKQSNETLTKAKSNSRFVREHISVILKHDIGFDIIIKTYDEDTITNLNSHIEDYKNSDATKEIKEAINTWIKTKYGFDIKDIIAFGTLEKEATKSKLEHYIDHVIANHRGFDKKESKKSYKCFANEDHHLKCNFIHVIHEDAGSSFNCLISTKLKYYHWSIIYKHYKD